MIKTPLLASLVCVALLSAGCGQPETAGPPAAAAPSAAAAAVPAVPAGPRVVEVTGNDQMKFSVARIEAKAGEELRIVLTNVGTLPKQAMGHNLVLLKKGTDVQAYAMAAMTAAANEYRPPALADQVVAATKLLGPKEKDEVTFTVPSEPGEYTYICSFPAHYLAGMRGVLVVQ